MTNSTDSADPFEILHQAQTRMYVTRGRALGLIRHALDVGFKTKKFDEALVAMDIIRAAVILMHATLEEFLRSVGKVLLPSATPEALDRIPLLGGSSQLDARKFLLGSLRSHESKAVGELIRECVEAHLNRRTFSSTAEINAFLKDCSLDPTDCASCYGVLDALLARRHKIVHQADATAADDPNVSIEAWPASSLWDVLRWAWELELFSVIVLRAAAPATAKDELAGHIADIKNDIVEAEAVAQELIKSYSARREPGNEFRRMLGLIQVPETTNKDVPK